MNPVICRRLNITIFIGIATLAPHVLQGQQQDARREARVSARASGTFEVKLTPQPPAHDTDAQSIGRLSIEKIYHGDLAGTAQGQMLTALTAVKGSAGYVAIERVTAKLHGKRGSFVLQHHGIMDRDEQSLTVVIVPDSGTDDLVGIEGSMKIMVNGGKHLYAMDYSLPAP